MKTRNANVEGSTSSRPTTTRLTSERVLFIAREASQLMMSRLATYPTKETVGQLAVGIVFKRTESYTSGGAYAVKQAAAGDREAFRRIVQETIETVIASITGEE